MKIFVTGGAGQVGSTVIDMLLARGDQVLAIDTVNMTVTLNLINGFSFGKPVWYLSMDASIPLAASIEHNTFAPLMANLQLGRDDSFSSPIERIFLAANGPEEGGCANTLRQGLSADLADGFRPNNVCRTM